MPSAPAELPDDKPGFGRPVELVIKAIAEITSTDSDEGKELSEIIVYVVPGGRPQDPHCTNTELTQEIKSLIHSLVRTC